MRKILNLFLGMIISLFFSSSVFAQTTCPVIPTLAVPIPGMVQTCGNATDPCNNKCCVNPIKKDAVTFSINDIPIVGGVVKQFFPGGNVIDTWRSSMSQVETNPCINGSPSTPGDLTNPGCTCIIPTQAPLESLKKMCANITNGGEKGQCEACVGGLGSEVGVWTSIGCVKANVSSFIQNTLLSWGIGIAGGVSMLCIMYAAFMMQTSSGNAEKIKKAQQLLTSCITGLMVIIFSVFILQLIGVKILRIPGFN